MNQDFHMAGRGHIYTAPVDTKKPQALEKYKFTTTGKFETGWEWIGDTSAESLPEFSTEGGEATTKRTWDRDNVYTVYTPQTYSATISSVNTSADIFKLGFGAEAASDGKSIDVGSNAGATERAMLIVMEDRDSVAALYLPRVAIKGQFPQFSTEDFTQIPLSINILSSDTQSSGKSPLLYSWMPPVARTTSS